MLDKAEVFYTKRHKSHLRKVISLRSHHPMIKTVAARYPLLLDDKVLNASFINTNSCYSHDIIQPIKFSGPIPSIVPWMPLHTVTLDFILYQ